jgi:isoleucyl-tRNA synthetase
LHLTATEQDHALLDSLGEDLKFVFITSAVTLQAGPQAGVQVSVSGAAKCERCWHYRDDVGHDRAHPGLCGRCTSNLYGAGEQRRIA